MWPQRHRSNYRLSRCDPKGIWPQRHQLQGRKWIVYPKATPGKPAKALEYLARYTHKVAISDSRIKSIENGRVTYTWRDRADNNTEKPDTIPVEEFTKRFCTHILPERFHKIRYGGWMSAARRKKTLAAIRETIGATTPEPPPEENAPPIPGFDRTLCPNCEKGHLQKTDKRILPCKARPPPWKINPPHNSSPEKALASARRPAVPKPRKTPLRGIRETGKTNAHRRRKKRNTMTMHRVIRHLSSPVYPTIGTLPHSNRRLRPTSFYPECHSIKLDPHSKRATLVALKIKR
jgi:hypothetical protein